MQLNMKNNTRYIQIDTKSMILADRTVEMLFCGSTLASTWHFATEFEVSTSGLRSEVTVFTFSGMNGEFFVLSVLNDFGTTTDSPPHSFLLWSMSAIANSTNAQNTNARQTSKYSPNAFKSDSDGLSDY